MKKIYSFVLMAAMLLVGTNAWALVSLPAGSGAGDLQDAINDAASGETIKLMGDITMDADEVIWLGTACVGDAAKSITLDLNGKNIKRTGNGGIHHFFVLSHGELKVINSASAESTIGFIGGTSNASSTIFAVYGSYKTDFAAQALIDGYFSHLYIGEKVKLNLPVGCLGSGITVDVISTKAADKANNIARWASNNAVNYTTAIVDGSYGYAYGVKVDLFGKIYSLGATGDPENPQSLKTYGIKTNGNLDSPLLTEKTFNLSTQANYSCMNGETINGQHPSTADAAYVPFVHVHSGSVIESSAISTRSAAVYASGYAKWLIEGTCTGSIGVSVSSGDITLNNATIESNGEKYTQPGSGTGVSGSGSAIVINSRDAYSGKMEVTISGATTVDATSGYGIQEVTNTTGSTGNKIDHVSIEGGTISGGNQGAIIVEEATATAKEVTIVAGAVTGTVSTGNDNTSVTPTTIETFVPGSTSTQPGAPADPDYNVILDEDVDNDGNNDIQVVPNTSKNVTLNAFGLATYSATGSKDRKLPSALTAYIVKTYNDDEVTLTPLESDEIPVGVGVILRGAVQEAAYVLDLLTDPASADASGNLLKPASEWTAGVAQENAYVLVGDELYLYTGTEMKANKAYLKLPAAGAPKRIKMVFAETQDIENVEFEAVKAVKFIENGQVLIKRGEKVYNVQGQIVK